MGIYLKDKGFKTEVKELGGSMLCFNALVSGEADMYPEYTGTVYSTIFKHTKILSEQDTYDMVKKESEEKYGITWLEPMGFNNTYVLSVTKETAKKYNLHNISDLAPYAKDLVLGGDSEFGVREIDGYPALIKKYGFQFKSYKSMDQGLTYQALVNEKIDINASYATDGRIAKYGLVNLKDDKQVFPPYYCTPIMKQSFVDKNPKVVAYLNKLKGVWSNEDMQKYNQMVDDGKDIDKVATQMLQDKNLI
jgi:glycine betaine/choline ABC-type transport system substrate-binding protein